MTEPRRDQYGRYLLPDPETGVEQAWTRATTVANTLADRWALEQWGNRNIVTGIGLRPDLYALAASSTPDDRELLTKIVEQAQEAAHASSAANLGTALHKLTERIDRDELLDVPDQWKPDVDAYCQTLADHSVKIIPELIERICVIPGLKVAGTFDRIVSFNGELMIADLKTGRHAVRYGVGEIAAQLAIYSRASHLWDEMLHGGAYDLMPEVSQTEALIIHLPVGEAHCGLYLVDITAGWYAVGLAMAVRDWRKMEGLAELVTVWEPSGVESSGDDW